MARSTAARRSAIGARSADIAVPLHRVDRRHAAGVCACSTNAARRADQALDVLRDEIGLEVHARRPRPARPASVTASVCGISVTPKNAAARHSTRTLIVRLTPSTVIDPFARGRAPTLGGAEISSSSAVPFSRRATTTPDAVDVPRHQVTAQRVAEPQRTLEVNARAHAPRAERREHQRLGAEVGGEPPARGSARRPSGTRRRRRCWRRAASAADVERGGHRRRRAPPLGRGPSVDDHAHGFDDSREHENRRAGIAVSAAGERPSMHQGCRGRRRPVSSMSPPDGAARWGRARSARGERAAEARGRAPTPPPSSCGATKSATRRPARLR